MKSLRESRFAAAVFVALVAACSSPRRARAPRASAPEENAAPARDLSVRDARGERGAQGVSGELVPSHGSSHFMFGIQSLDDDAWSPVDEHLFVGFETAFETEGDLIGGEWGMSLAMSEDAESVNDSSLGVGEYDVDLEIIELYGGIHRSFLRGTRFRPYVGAGFGLLWYDARQQFRAAGNPTREDEHDGFTYGPYLHGGVTVQLGENMQAGIDLRMLAGTDTDGLIKDGDLDYQRIALFFGVGN